MTSARPAENKLSAEDRPIPAIRLESLNLVASFLFIDSTFSGKPCRSLNIHRVGSVDSALIAMDLPSISI